MSRRTHQNSYQIAGRTVVSCGPGCYEYRGALIRRSGRLNCWVADHHGGSRSLAELLDRIDLRVGVRTKSPADLDIKSRRVV